MGKLIFRYGTMNSGKSLHLLATAHNFTERGIRFALLKSTLDTRDGNGVIHSRPLGEKGSMECLNVSEDADVFHMIKGLCGTPGLKWVLVDEAQFLSEKQVEDLAAAADMLGVRVICYGLRTDFRTKLFPGSRRLFELADTVEEIKSSCTCDGKTIVNARVDGNGDVVVEGNQIMIGGEDRYLSMCRKCYFTRLGDPRYVFAKQKKEQ